MPSGQQKFQSEVCEITLPNREKVFPRAVQHIRDILGFTPTPYLFPKGQAHANTRP